MRKRRVQPIGVLPVPWATFGCSIATCTSLLRCSYMEMVLNVLLSAESLPAAPSVAIRSLQQASQAARQKDENRIQKSIQLLMYRLKNARIQ
ncbi:hypothetical protein like AT2G43250 [Hibiscus trionum]|uniref:Uncharacterized protein n=1 Tax=Hibiscus trionum TaxID=183268 RepID=A0A9W7HA47_HIBTR|nr:hypothetical protein like AT2G43250 [Hibiscus trionum]